MSLRILHLEDDALDRELIARAIEEEGMQVSVTPVATREGFTAALERERFDLILSDFVIPKYGGGEALQTARKLAPDTPFIFVSGKMPEEIAIDKLRVGATDYVSKSHLALLGPMVRRVMRQCAETSRRRMLEQELATAADAAGFGIYEHDLAAGVLEWSAELKTIFGFPCDTPVTPAQAAAQIHSEDAEAVQSAWQDALDPGGAGIFESEHRVLRNDGEIRNLLVKARITFKGEGDARRPVLESGVMVDVTRRKAAESSLRASEMKQRENYDEAARAQTALRESEERLEAVVENLTEGLVIADAAGNLVLWNRAALAMHGFATLAEAQRRLPEFAETFEIVDMEGRVLALEEWPLARILRGEQLQNMEAKWRRRDTGAERIVSYGGTIARSAANARLAFLTITDITERKQAEAALRESEAHLRRVLDGLFAFVAVLDRDGVLCEVNRAPLEAAGLTFADVVGKKFWECHWWSYSEGAQARAREACERALAGEAPRFDVPVRIAGDSLTWMDFQIAPLRDDMGRITHLVPSAMDITARRSAEQASSESAERFRTLADNMSQLAWMADEDGRPFWWNERWFEYTGTTLKDMDREGWRRVNDPDHFERVDAKFRRHVAMGEAWEDTFPLRGRDGQYRWFLSRALPIKDAAGKVLRWFGTNTDVTERLQAEAALREADRRKDEFLAMLGHELRNPLSAIRNATTLLKEGGNDPENVEWAHAILERQSNNLARMVDDLLDVARITRGQVELRKEVVSLSQIARSAAAAISQLVAAKRHRLELKIADPAGPRVLGDAARLEQVVVNLLTNAIKYTPAGGVISVSVREEGKEALISVRDTGIGMPATLLPHIFELFIQGDRSLDRAEGGLGIGLNLCRQLVTLHGGVIEAHSEGVGLGCEFIARFPLHVAAQAEEQTAPPPPGAAHGLQGNSRRVLVVDDNVDTARSLERVLTRRGFEVAVAHDGPGGERMAHQFAPEICLLDIGLPGFDGYELARRLRSRGPCQEALMIAISGYAQEGDRRQSRVSGFDAHFAKPVDLDRLFEEIASPSK